MKPIHGYGGNEIYLIHKKFDKILIKKFIKRHGHVMFQKFLPKIKNGDKRVFIINGKIWCNFKNSHALTIKISKLVALRLKRNDIYFSGIDFIDQKLNGDINVTSPTGRKTYF